jgi:SAM-dependent methyltransferase
MKPEYVTDIKPRKSEWPEHHVNLPPLVPQPDFMDPGHMDWYNEYVNFSVHIANFPLAKELAEKLWIAHRENNQKEVQVLFKKLRSLRTIPFEKRTSLEKWAHMMVQLPGDIGGPNKKKIRKLLSAKCQGHVLEAMCGFNSYLELSPNREVIALDYCREALERYPYPERTRILFDLNTIKENQRIEFFKEGEFNTVTICFGFHYLHHPVWLFREFHRLLSPDGQLILVENPYQCYRDIACRSFSPGHCVNFLHRAFFKNVKVEELPIAEDWEQKFGGRYFLIKAKRS